MISLACVHRDSRVIGEWNGLRHKQPCEKLGRGSIRQKNICNRASEIFETLTILPAGVFLCCLPCRESRNTILVDPVERGIGLSYRRLRDQLWVMLALRRTKPPDRPIYRYHVNKHEKMHVRLSLQPRPMAGSESLSAFVSRWRPSFRLVTCPPH